MSCEKTHIFENHNPSCNKKKPNYTSDLLPGTLSSLTIWNIYVPIFEKFVGERGELLFFTPASNLGYLAPPPPPGQFFMGAKLFIGTPWMGNKGVLKKILVWAM